MRNASPWIVSTYLDVDGKVSGTRSEPVLARAESLGLVSRELVIQPLSAGWDAEPPGTFKSGAGPIFALAEACRLLESEADVVVISGKDLLRTGYTSEERARQMAVFGEVTVADLYTDLAEVFMKNQGMSTDEFREVARALEANYRRTAERRGVKIAPAGSHERPVTRLFRLVDCANPVVDFEGEVVLATPEAAQKLGVAAKDCARVAAVATAEVPDGPEQIGALAGYGHLRAVVERIGEQVDLQRLLEPDAALEVYTCFPVVPLAFLMALLETLGREGTLAEVLELLAEREITTTGGMNFARAPWNNPALHGLILVARAVVAGAGMGLVHGNGGLGGRQGVAVVGRV